MHKALGLLSNRHTLRKSDQVSHTQYQLSYILPTLHSRLCSHHSHHTPSHTTTTRTSIHSQALHIPSRCTGKSCSPSSRTSFSHWKGQNSASRLETIHTGECFGIGRRIPSNELMLRPLRRCCCWWQGPLGESPQRGRQ